MPLHAENEAVRVGALDRLDDAIIGPGNRLQALAHVIGIGGLVVVGVDGDGRLPEQAFHDVTALDRDRVFQVADIVGGDVIFHVLDQFAAESDGAELRPGTDSQHRHAVVFLQHHPGEDQVRLGQPLVARGVFHLGLDPLRLAVHLGRVIVDADKEEAVGHLDVLPENGLVGETRHEQGNATGLEDLIDIAIVNPVFVAEGEVGFVLFGTNDPAAAGELGPVVV